MIDEKGFWKSGLQSIAFSQNSRLWRIGMEAFSLCSDLTAIEIPSLVQEVYPFAFSKSGIQSITFAPNSKLKAFSAKIFANCWNLFSIEIPPSIEEIDADTFKDIKVQFVTDPIDFQHNKDGEEVNMSEIRFSATVAMGSKLVTRSEVQYIPFALDSGLKTSSWSLFTNVEQVSLEIPSSVEKIEKNAFLKTNLQSITFLPNS